MVLDSLPHWLTPDGAEAIAQAMMSIPGALAAAASPWEANDIGIPMSFASQGEAAAAKAPGIDIIACAIASAPSGVSQCGKLSSTIDKIYSSEFRISRGRNCGPQGSRYWTRVEI